MKTISTLLGMLLLTATTLLAQDIYVAGFDNDGTSSNRIAQIWEGDGTKHNLTNGTRSASAIDVFIYDEDLYAVGYQRNPANIFVATIWENGTLQNLTDGSNHAQARAVFVHAGDVYVAGYENNGTKNVAKLWKNGNVQNLTDGSENAEAEAVFISNGDVYVLGIEYDFSVDDQNIDAVIKVWKNGTVQNLTSGNQSAWATSLFVDNGDVYVTGSEYNGTNHIAKVWKNGNPQNLTTGSNNARAESVFVSNGDVYVTGYDGSQPKLWINGVEETLYYNTNLDGGRGHSVYVSGSDVYVAGRLTESNGSDVCNLAALWKNGQVEFTSAAPGCVEDTTMHAVVVDDDQLSTNTMAMPHNSVSLYPNPAQDVLHISTTQPTVVQLFSLQGQMLQEMEVEQNAQVDISNLTSGLYLLKDMNTGITQKVVKK